MYQYDPMREIPNNVMIYQIEALEVCSGKEDVIIWKKNT